MISLVDKKKAKSTAPSYMLVHQKFHPNQAQGSIFQATELRFIYFAF
jgi:hypothetical protein